MAVQRCDHGENVLAWEVYAVSVAAIVLKVWTAAVHSAKVRRERYEKSLAVFHDCDVKNTRPFLVRPLHVFFHLKYFYLADPRRALYCLVLKLFVHSYFTEPLRYYSILRVCVHAYSYCHHLYKYFSVRVCISQKVYYAKYTLWQSLFCSKNYCDLPRKKGLYKYFKPI